MAVYTISKVIDRIFCCFFLLSLSAVSAAPVHDAVSLQDLNTLELLVESGVDLN